MKRFAVLLVKIGLSLGIVAYLVIDAQRNSVFSELRDQPKQWGTLFFAWVVGASAVVLTMIRWCYLARAIGIPLTLRNAIRLGFLGYLFNLAPMGIVGGDGLKTVMLARETKSGFGKALASVAVDRLIGLYMLFVVASLALIWSGMWWNASGELATVCRVSMWVAIGGAVGIGLLFVPWFTEGAWILRLSHHPRLGRYCRSLIESVRAYRNRPTVLAVSAVMSIAVHLLASVGVYLIAHGLPGKTLSLVSHVVAVPLAAAGAVIPLPLGPFEWILDLLYSTLPLPDGSLLLRGKGLVVALGYRINCVLTASIGICYYLGSRKEVAEVVQHPDELEETES